MDGCSMPKILYQKWDFRHFAELARDICFWVQFKNLCAKRQKGSLGVYKLVKPFLKKVLNISVPHAKLFSFFIGHHYFHTTCKLHALSIHTQCLYWGPEFKQSQHSLTKMLILQYIKNKTKKNSLCLEVKMYLGQPCSQ